MTFSWRVKSVSGSLIWKEGPITQINDLIEQIFIEMWARKDFQLVKVSEIASSLQIDLSDYRQILTMSSHLQSHRDLNIFYSSRWDGSLGRRLNLTKTFSRLSTISFSGEAFTVPVSHANKRPFQTRKEISVQVTRKIFTLLSSQYCFLSFSLTLEERMKVFIYPLTI